MLRALSMMLTCVSVAGCAFPPKPSPDPAIQIPRNCEELAERADEPAWRKGASAKALLADTTVKLIEANANLDATRTCQQQQREAFANPSRVTE